MSVSQGLIKKNVARSHDPAPRAPAPPTWVSACCSGRMGGRRLGSEACSPGWVALVALLHFLGRPLVAVVRLWVGLARSTCGGRC